MLAMIRNYAAGIVLSLALGCVSVIYPRWPELLGFEVNSSQSESYLVLAPEQTAIIYKMRIEAKVQIVSRLRAGELDLFEATAWFGCVNREPAELVDRSWQYSPGVSKEEKMCRQVINWARGQFSQSMPDSELGLFVEKLEAQLAARLCSHGRIELPEWK